MPPPEPGRYHSAQYPGTPNATLTKTGFTTIMPYTLAAKGRHIDYLLRQLQFTEHPITATLAERDEVHGTATDRRPEATWVITGGTGAYAGLQGNGNADANAENTFPG